MKKHNEHRYAFWLDRWVDVLAKAAPYYAPRLMAMAVQSQVQVEDKRARADPREVMLEIYLEILRRGELTGKVLDERQKKINGPPPARVEDAVTPVPWGACRNRGCRFTARRLRFFQSERGKMSVCSRCYCPMLLVDYALAEMLPCPWGEECPFWVKDDGEPASSEPQGQA